MSVEYINFWITVGIIFGGVSLYLGLILTGIFWILAEINNRLK